MYRNGNLLRNARRDANEREITIGAPECGETAEFYMTSVNAVTGGESEPSHRYTWTPRPDRCPRTMFVTFETLDTPRNTR